MYKRQGHEIVYISDEVVTARCIQAWQQSGMKLLGCGRGTPVNVDWRAVHHSGIPLVYTPGRNANSVSEFIFGLLIGLVRRIAADAHALRSGRYLGPAKENVLVLDPQQDVVWFMPDGSSPMRDFGGGFELYGRTPVSYTHLKPFSKKEIEQAKLQLRRQRRTETQQAPQRRRPPENEQRRPQQAAKQPPRRRPEGQQPRPQPKRPAPSNRYAPDEEEFFARRQ